MADEEPDVQVLATEMFKKLFEETFEGGTTDEQGFASLIGWHPQVLGSLYAKYAVQLDEGKVTPRRLLQAYSWMKTYVTWNVFSLIWREKRTNLEKTTKATIAVLFAVLDEVRIGSISKNLLNTPLTSNFTQIDPNRRLTDPYPTTGLFANHTFIVDVTECPLQRPTNHYAELASFSPKANVCSLKYEGTAGRNDSIG